MLKMLLDIFKPNKQASYIATPLSEQNQAVRENPFQCHISNESVLRKQRSISQLARLGVPYLSQMPCPADEEHSVRRPITQVVNRALALLLVAAKGEGVAELTLQQLTDRYAVRMSFTPQEAHFMSTRDVNEEKYIAFLWRYEAAWVVLWALSYVDELNLPEHTCDMAYAVQCFKSRSRACFSGEAVLRPPSEILDEADLYARLFWAAQDADKRQLDLAGELNARVIRQRYYALMWLIGFHDLSWDEVVGPE